MASQIHGTCVALGATGVLLRGPAGSGKSDLALRLIDGAASLVADDRVALENEAGGVARARIGVVVDLDPAGEVERLPEPATCELLGVTLRCFRLDPFAASACAKVRLAADTVTRDILVHP